MESDCRGVVEVDETFWGGEEQLAEGRSRKP